MVTLRTRPEVPNRLRASTVTCTAPETIDRPRRRSHAIVVRPGRVRRLRASVASVAPEADSTRTVTRAGRSRRKPTASRARARRPAPLTEGRAVNAESVRSKITRRRCSVSPLLSSGVNLATIT